MAKVFNCDDVDDLDELRIIRNKVWMTRRVIGANFDKNSLMIISVDASDRKLVGTLRDRVREWTLRGKTFSLTEVSSGKGGIWVWGRAQDKEKAERSLARIDRREVTRFKKLLDKNY